MNEEIKNTLRKIRDILLQMEWMNQNYLIGIMNPLGKATIEQMETFLKWIQNNRNKGPQEMREKAKEIVKN